MADHVRDPVLQRPERAAASQARVPWTTAAQATLRCLTGCAIGEVLGMVIGTAAGLPDVTTVALSRGRGHAILHRYHHAAPSPQTGNRRC